MSGSGKHHRRLSSLDSTMRRLRLSDDAASSPSSADLEAGLPRRPLTDRPASGAASARQASSPPALPCCHLRVWHPTAASILCRTPFDQMQTVSACIAERLFRRQIQASCSTFHCNRCIKVWPMMIRSAN